MRGSMPYHQIQCTNSLLICNYKEHWPFTWSSFSTITTYHTGYSECGAWRIGTTLTEFIPGMNGKVYPTNEEMATTSNGPYLKAILGMLSLTIMSINPISYPKLMS